MLSNKIAKIAKIVTANYKLNKITDQDFNKLPNIDYYTHAASSVNFIPPTSVINDWKDDYQSLSNTFIYADAEKITFDELLKRMEELKTRIRALNTDGSN